MGWLREFDDIRPYTDSELPRVLRRIRRNRWLISGIRRMRVPDCPKILRPFAHAVIRLDLWIRLRRYNSIDDFQRTVVVDRVLHYIVRKTSRGLTWSGTERLGRGKAYLFISNHRDIVLDSALLNYALAKSDLDIAEIAFGDNLLSNEFVSDLIRINKSFIVYRNLPLRAKAKAAIRLSKYIYMTRSHGNSVWIAQREGRAKDGKDSTNPSILKMVYHEARKEGMDFESFVDWLPIIPVAVSYEFDPCDRFKSRELSRTRENGTYNKRKSEDLISIYAGLKGDKGRIHIAFGEPLNKVADIKSAAAAIDRQIAELYRLWPSNFVAYDNRQGKSDYNDRYSPSEEQVFLERFRKETLSVKSIAYEIYSAPVENQLKAE